MKGRTVHPSRNARYFEDRFRLGCEDQPCPIPVDVDRFDAQSVPADEEFPLSRIPQCKTEHPVQAMNKLLAPLFVRMKKHFTVGSGTKTVADPLEFGPKLPEIVDFTVAHEP